ncbi:hypothetical protein CVT24_004922 [Panaeolus cyanescens]|uniref:Zn-dependent exopeptidase n=1 Tax=Panaeolus cyanescens TaxID=181874 RepID=A0A409V9L0_9AGAR|nr:hypothetical protein CVT24_004922 [Panaeolus cyanescens]
MDIEKQPKKGDELFQLPPTSKPASRDQCRATRRAFVKGALFVSVLLALKLFATHVVLPGANFASKPHHKHRHRLNTEEREKLFLSVPNAESAIEASRAYATHPHLAGSSEDLLDAKTILHLFQDEFHIHRPEHLPIYKAGSEESRKATLSLTDKHGPRRPTAWIDTYYPVMNTGLDRSLEILGDDGNPVWTADLLEDGDPRDEDAHKYKETIPSWHGLSADGDVSGQLVYANYGRKEDYDELVEQGANLTGKVVLARYGANFRGLKIKGAQELGAVGVLIYSDPRDDGFVTTANDYPPYPAGPARNPSSIQRGSVQFLSSYPGDPTTPGYPAYEDAERTEGSNIPKIPSLPISWANAQRLLEEIDNVYDVDKDGKKVLSGKASSSAVHMVNHVDTKVTPIWNTMAAIPGHIKNEVVVIGCHRDAWVLGAADPTSGTVSLHEIIRGFGALLRHGWKPLRTVVIASWDAEEAKWGEDFASWISDNVVAYLNVDVSVSGSRFTASASPSLAHLIQRTASDIPHPTSEGKTLWDAIDDDGPYTELALNGSAADPEFMEMYMAAEEQRKASKTRVHPLGSGSDFTVFLQRLGVASSDQGFGITPTDPVYHYHSIYDSQSWQERYGDKGFHRHVAVAQHLGLLGLRIIDSIVLPLNTTQYALELEEYLDKVESLLPSLGNEAQNVQFFSLRKTIQRVQEASFDLDQEKAVAEEEFKKLLRKLPWGPRQAGKCTRHRGLYRKFADFVKSVLGVAAPSEEQLSRIHGHWDAHSWLAYLDGTVDVDEAEKLIVQHLDHKKPHKFPIRRFIEAAKRVGRANKRLLKFERGFISEGGIKDREWYKHLGVAPGKWLGYGATTFPALTEAITYEKNARMINYEADRSVPNEESAREASLAYATHPHIAGSSEDLLDAKALLHLFQDEFHISKPDQVPIYEAGSTESRNAILSLTDKHGPRRPTAWIDTYYPVLNQGISQTLEILNEDGKVGWTADLLEDGDPGDEDAHKYRLSIPPFHGYSADGDVTGQLVYANYGQKEDYDELVARGTNLTGKIVIARYGGAARGLKVKGAEDLGAVGVLLYSDPRDDGYVTTENGYLPYPAGPARNPTAIERGSLLYLTEYPGDPSTPGYPAYEGAERVEFTNVPRIPSLPVSWGNAQKLLGEIGRIHEYDEANKRVLSGRHSSRYIHLVNRVEYKVTPIWNTMAAIPGHIKDEVVILGCHRDAWVMGAADPTSGTVSLHELIRGFGTLLRRGWKPLRTVIIASWDAEEYGLTGSTEWAEDFSSWISENVASYLNLDTSVAGSLFMAGASPSLAHLIRGTAEELPHPNIPGKTLWDATEDEGPFKGALDIAGIDYDFLRSYETSKEERKASDTGIIALGSGSDFTAFLQRLGVASSHIGFDLTPSDAVYHYHSIYDTHAWQERYGDVGFHKHVAIAKHLGLLALRLTDSFVLPLNTTQYALELDNYMAKVESLLPSADGTKVAFSSLKRAIQRVQEASALLDKEKADAEEDFRKLLKRLHWWRRHDGACSKQTSVYKRFFNFMKSVLGISPSSADQPQDAFDDQSFLQYLDNSLDIDDAKHLPSPIRRFIQAVKRLGRVNKKLLNFERGFISEGGIKDREWYKHLGVAPGKWLGYGATTFPALTEAITIEKDEKLAEYEANRLAVLLVKLADMIQP